MRAPGPAIISRPRVSDLLAGAWHRRVTVVVAGAGYGKTTALTGLAATGPSAWVRVTPADAQAESLAARIAAALGQSQSRQRSPIAAATGSDDRRLLAEHRAALLCELAEARGAPLLLVLDGLEQIGSDAAASHLLRVLALEAPHQLRLVLSGRTLPELGLGGAQGRGELLEVTAPDLSFDAAETAELVVSRLGAGAASLAAQCCTLTGGWPAAMQLLLDRLERQDEVSHSRTLSRLERDRGQLWRAFARELVADEQPAARQVLAVAATLPRVDAGLLTGAGIAATSADLDELHRRGLLAEVGEPGSYQLSPVLTGAIPPADDATGVRAARWLEANGRLAEALEWHARGSQDAARSFLARHGPALIRAGAATRLIEVLRSHGTGDRADLDAVLGEALQSAGQWDAAMEVFARLAYAAGPQPLPASVAWRYGLLLYLRGDSAAAASTLATAHDPAATGADDAMTTAWLSSTLWSQGKAEEADDLASIALRQARASADACAIAAAHVSLALAAASRGDRDRNEAEYRLALAAATDGGDRAQLARIHANLSSRALENGAYAQAIAEAELALETGTGHRYFAALALINKADAHLRLGQLDDARATVAEAEAICAALGTLLSALPQALYGELYRLRGDLVRARTCFERARALAIEGDDAHALVTALSGLARVLAAEDVPAARSMAAAAIATASSLERASALCAAADVELRMPDAAAALSFARQAEAEARRTGDQAALAEALELAAAAVTDGAESRLRSAAQLWDDIGNPAGAARARHALALLAGHQKHPEAPAAPECSIVALGRFAVLQAGQPVPLAVWQSRKARDLLKLLVARKGRPITREAAAEAMWPGEAPEALGNRLSVALSTIRKVLDPARRHPAGYYLNADGRTIALRTEHVSVDLLEFGRVADAAAALLSSGDLVGAEGHLRLARQIYAGDFLEEDLYEEWAAGTREETRARLLTVLRSLARLAADRGDDEAASQQLSQVLEQEPYDEDAWLCLVACLLRLRRHGQARRSYAAYARRMSELGVVPVALADAAGWRP